MAVALTEVSNGSYQAPFPDTHRVVPEPNGLIDAQHAYYSLFYETNGSDSTPKSRGSLINRLNDALPFLTPGAVILDLGAGRQILEAEHISQFGIPETIYNGQGEYVRAYNFLTVDHATLHPDQLMAQDAPHVSHLQASGDRLDAIPDASVHVAISNLALDFMPRAAIGELDRVLAPGGKVFLNLSNPRSVIPSNLDDSYARINRKLFGNKWSRNKPQKAEDRRTLLMLKNKRMLRDAKGLFENEQQIMETFKAFGFSLVDIRNCHQEDLDGSTMCWWEVDLQKPTEHELALEVFSQNLIDALSFDPDDFATSAKSLYFQHLRNNSIVARQNIAARVVTAWDPENEDPYRPDPSILLEGSVQFAANGARAVGKGSEDWWIQIAMGIVSAERPVTENGVLRLLPIAADGRVHGNRNTRDQMMTMYGELLTEANLDK